MPLPVGPVTRIRPCGRARNLSATWSCALEETDVGQIAQERARIEEADDELLAERDGDRRDAHLDLAVAARRLDAPVLRAALLGDVEARERLDARHDRGVDDLRQRVHVVQDAVDAHAHGGVLAPRLDVHVARALVERVVEEVLDRGDDVAVARLDLLDAFELDVPLEVADVDAAGRLLLGRVDRAAEAVEVGDEPLDLRRRRDDEPRLAAHVGLQVLHERVIERVRDGDGHGAIVGGDDERPVPAGEGARQELGRQLRVDLERVEIDERHAEVLRERLHHDALGQRIAIVAALSEAHRHDDLGGVDALADAGALACADRRRAGGAAARERRRRARPSRAAARS